MFDTIEIEVDIVNGPKAGEYQTKDLESVMDTYVLENNKLYRKTYEFVKIKPKQDKPKWPLYKRKYLGLLDIEFHGWIEIYGAYDTWRLKFTDGELKECKLVETFEIKENDETTETTEEEYAGHIGIPDGYFDNNEREIEFDEEDFEG